jgi:hypothetical protein
MMLESRHGAESLSAAPEGVRRRSPERFPLRRVRGTEENVAALCVPDFRIGHSRRSIRPEGHGKDRLGRCTHGRCRLGRRGIRGEPKLVLNRRSLRRPIHRRVMESR